MPKKLRQLAEPPKKIRPRLGSVPSYITKNSFSNKDGFLLFFSLPTVPVLPAVSPSYSQGCLKRFIQQTFDVHTFPQCPTVYWWQKTEPTKQHLITFIHHFGVDWWTLLWQHRVSAGVPTARQAVHLRPAFDIFVSEEVRDFWNGFHPIWIYRGKFTGLHLHNNEQNCWKRSAQWVWSSWIEKIK